MTLVLTSSAAVYQLATPCAVTTSETMTSLDAEHPPTLCCE